MEISTGNLLLYGAIGIAFQYLMIFFAVRHANEKQDKKIEELEQLIRELKS